MRDRKLVLVLTLVLVLFMAAGLYYYSISGKVSTGEPSLESASPLISQDCAKEGEQIGALGSPEICCKGLKPLGDCKDGLNGDCETPCLPGGIIRCQKCGDGKCDTKIEGKCNCPEDCQ